MIRRHALLVEELAFDPVRKALHVKRPSPEMWKHELGDADVVGDDIGLRQVGFREEHLAGVRHWNVATADPHLASIVEA
jgi:hypothetical protein